MLNVNDIDNISIFQHMYNETRDCMGELKTLLKMYASVDARK